MSHYQAVKDARDGDYLPIATALAYFIEQSEEGQRELHPTGRLWDTSKRIPSMMYRRYAQLQELEAILVYVELVADRKTVEYKQHLQGTAMRAYTDKQKNELVLTDNTVYMLRQLQNEIALVRNTFMGLTKGLESLHFQMNNLVKLREAGIEDATF